jgi:molybdopterin synthase catalytic subunit
VEGAPAPDGRDWLALVDGPLALDAAAAWVVRPDCGAVVTFAGTTRDHSGDPAAGDGRTGVTAIEYEAYEEQAVPRLAAVATELRRRWPAVGRLVLWHRTGEVRLGEASVVVAVSAPHRGEAFEAARYGIDAVKATVPIWKRERWPGGESWGTDATPIDEAAAVSAREAGSP